MKKNKISTKAYESYSYGPFRIERLGRIIKMSSNLNKEDLEKFKSFLKKERPNSKEDIDRNIAELLLLIQLYNPIDFLTTIALQNCFSDSEIYTESSHKGRECLIEFALSLILSQTRRKGLPHATQEAINKFSDLISKTMDEVLTYFSSEASENKNNKLEYEIRLILISRYLYVRGDSYQEHHIEMIRDIFKPHDAFFKEQYDLECDKIISILERISNQPAKNLLPHIQAMASLKKSHELFKKFIDEKGTDTFISIEDMKNQFLTLPQTQEMQLEFGKKRHLLEKNIFEITPSEELPQNILDLLSSTFGNNTSFVKEPAFNAWPTNDSIINTHPLIKDDNKYYCFIPQLIFRQAGDILEQMIKNKNENYYTNTYFKKRSNYLEKKTLDYLSRLMPDAKIYHNLYYDFNHNGKLSRFETDGIIIYDTNLFIIEAKAGRLSLSSKRGSLLRLKNDLNKLVEESFQQAERVKRYINETKEPTFKNEENTEVLRLNNKNHFKNIYLINTTLQPLGSLAAHLPTIRNIGYLKGLEWPWSVYINDLKVISEILESPTQFLLYLQRRIKSNDYPQYHSHDELNLLMVYLKEGLYFEDGLFEQKTMIMPHGYTEDLDRYYDFIAGRVSSGEKPKIQLDLEYEELIREIEASGKFGFTDASTTLLSFDASTRKEFLKGLKDSLQLAKTDEKDHDFTMYFSSFKKGFTCSVSYNRKTDFWENISKYCRLKLYQTKFNTWILITIDVDSKGKRVFNFCTYIEKWGFNKEMEKRLEYFKALKLEKSKMNREKIGRNNKCPCDSNLKYKKCCGK